MKLVHCRVRLFPAIVIGALSVAAMNNTALAHHSFAMFDREKSATVRGTVRDFQFTNPHCWIQLLVPGQNGQTEWSIEMAAPSHLVSSGWTKKTIKPGDKISVVIRPLRNGGNGGSFVSATDVSGHPL